MSPLHSPPQLEKRSHTMHTGILVCYAPGSEEAPYNASLGRRAEIPSNAAETSDGYVLGTSRDTFLPGSYGLVCDVQAAADQHEGWSQALAHEAGDHDTRPNGATTPLAVCSFLAV
jgi:hypothetical protein